MLVLGIDPAPVKKSVVFDGVKFREFTPYNLKRFIDKISFRHKSIFIAWDAPLSAAIDKDNFNLYERRIEKYFNRNNKKIRDFFIPKGISTLGYASCSHWTISQYIFGYPNLNPLLNSSHTYQLVQHTRDINFVDGLQITETHPALALWIVLKELLAEHPLFVETWQYKGVDAKDKSNKKRREIIIDTLFVIPFVADEIDLSLYKDELLDSDDKLDAFFCWLLASKLLKKNRNVTIFGDNKVGSFLLAYDKSIYEYFQNLK